MNGWMDGRTNKLIDRYGSLVDCEVQKVSFLLIRGSLRWPADIYLANRCLFKSRFFYSRTSSVS